MSTDSEQRFRILAMLNLLNAQADPALDRLTRIAASATGAPTALVTFIGPDRLWVASRVGWDTGYTTLLEAFCVQALEGPVLLEVPDATKDERFSDNPFVSGPSAIRFYAGHPIVFDGTILGTVCVFDRIPRNLTPSERNILSDLAGMVGDYLQLRQQQSLLRQEEQRALGLAHALGASESRLAAAQRVAKLGSWELDPTTGEAICSEEMFHLIGVVPTSGTMNFAEFAAKVHPDDVERFKAASDRVFSQRSIVEEQFRVLWEQGEMRWLHAFSEPVVDAAGRVTRLIGTAQDITERKRTESSLRESEDLYRLLWHTTTDVVLLIDQSSRIYSANPALEDIFGHKATQVVGEPLSLLQPERLRAAHERGLARYLSSGKRTVDWRATQAVGLHRDGHEFPIEISFSDLTLDGQRVFAAYIRDITHQEKVQSAKQVLQAQLRESQKMEAIGVLAGGIAHDFNNVLAGILGNASLARQDLDADHRAIHSLEQIHKAGVRGRALVQQILAFARRQPKELAVCGLRPLVEETIGLLRSTLPAGVQITTDFPPAPVLVLADATQIEQVVMNLCTNAWHALGGTSGRIDIGLEEVERDSSAGRPDTLPSPCAWAHLWVTDNGRGMDASTREHIFEPFFTTKPPGQGTGLGLSVVHGIVASHSGELVVESAPGAGSTFHVYLPVCAASNAQTPHTDPPIASRGTGQHVMVIDDDDVMVVLVERMLQRLGYRVSAFQAARDAVAALRAAPDAFDVVVTDLNMPELSGLDVAREVHAVRPGLAVLITSGNLPDALRSEAHHLGVRGWMHKQNTLEELGPMLGAILSATPTG